MPVVALDRHWLHFQRENGQILFLFLALSGNYMYIYIFASVSSFFLRQARYVFRQIQSTFEQIPRLLGLCQLSFIPLLSVLLVEIRS